MEPMLRFKADDGSDFPDWEKKTLGEVFTEIKEKNRSDLPVLSVQQGAGTVLRDSSERRIAYNKNSLNNYKAMRKGDFIIHLRSFEGGLECSNYDGISSPAYHILRSNMILSDAFKDYFRSYAFIKGKLSDAVFGIRDGKNIDMSTFWEIQMSIPSLPEQCKIADLLSAVDDVIAAQETEVAAWKKRKKGVMQKLFSQEVRFKADDGSDFPDWEEKKFGDIWKRIVVKNDGSFGGDKIISVANMKWAPKDDVRDDYLKTYNLLPSNAIAFEGHRNNFYSYGRFVLNDIGEGIVSHVFVCFEPIADIIPAFWKEYIHAECVMGKILRKCTKSSTMMHDLVVPDFLKQIIFVPSLSEQRKIADCLISLDDVIAKAKDELAKWQELKKGLLQQMFV